VTAHADRGAVCERDVKGHAGSGELEMHRVPADDFVENGRARIGVRPAASPARHAAPSFPRRG
jgi:hypothetical protein